MKSLTGKRRKRRLRGKLKEQERVLVHYFRYYGIREYTPAALEYISGDMRKHEERWALICGSAAHKAYYGPKNSDLHQLHIQFSTYEEAMAHVMERKLNMLADDYYEGWYLYNYIPYKVSIVRGTRKKHRTIWVKDLGTKL